MMTLRHVICLWAALAMALPPSVFAEPVQDNEKQVTRLFGRFRRGGSGCGSGCNTGCNTGGGCNVGRGCNTGCNTGCSTGGCNVRRRVVDPQPVQPQLAGPARPQRATQVAAAQAVAENRLIVFTADWCHVCQQFKPTLAEAKQAGLAIFTIDVDERKDLVEKYNIRTIPASFVIRKNRLINRRPFVGLLSLKEIHDLLGGKQIGYTPLKPNEKLVSCGDVARRRVRQSAPVQAPDPVPILARQSLPPQAAPPQAQVARVNNTLARKSVANAFVSKEVQENVRRATVRILNYVNPDYSPVVTGQVIAARKGSDGYTRAWILTCWHGFIGDVGTIRITFPDGYIRKGRLIATDVKHDLAVVMCYARDDVPVVPVATGIVNSKNAQQGLVNVGYGPDGQLFIGKGPYQGYVQVSHNAGEVKHVPIEKSDKYVTRTNQIVMRGETLTGDSGGGIYTPAGALVGVVWGTPSDAYVYGTYNGTVNRFLNSHKQVAAARWQRNRKDCRFKPSMQVPPAPPIVDAPAITADDPLSDLDPMDEPDVDDSEPPFEPMDDEPMDTPDTQVVHGEDHDEILQRLQELLTRVDGLEDHGAAIQTLAGRVDQLPTKEQLDQLLVGQGAIARTQDEIAGTLGMVAEVTDKARVAAEGAKTAATGLADDTAAAKDAAQGAQAAAQQAAENLDGVKATANSALAKLADIQAQLERGNELTLVVDTPPNLSPSYVDVSAYWAVQRATGISHIVLMVNSADPDWQNRLKAEYEAAHAKFPMIRLVDVQSSTMNISPVPQMVVYYHTEGGDPRSPEFYKGDREVSEALQAIVRQS